MLNNTHTAMKKAAAIAIFGLSLIVLIYLYYVLIDYRVIRTIEHSSKALELLRFIDFAALLPFFVKYRQHRWTS